MATKDDNKVSLSDLVAKVKAGFSRAGTNFKQGRFSPITPASIQEGISSGETLSRYAKLKAEKQDTSTIPGFLASSALGATSKIVGAATYPLRLAKRGSEHLQKGSKGTYEGGKKIVQGGLRGDAELAALGTKELGKGVLESGLGVGEMAAAGGVIYHGGKFLIKGGPKGIGLRTAQGGVLGTGMGVGAQLLTGGGLPTKEQARDYFQSGIENSWTLAITNGITDKLLGYVAPNLVGEALTEPFKQGAVREGFKQVFMRALAEVPAENTAFTWLDRMNTEEKTTFMQDWWNNLPGNIGTNLLFALGQGSFETLKNKESRKAISDALKTTIDHNFRTKVNLMEWDKNGHRKTMTMWEYENRNKIGLTVRGTNELSIEDYAKLKGISVEEAKKLRPKDLIKADVKGKAAQGELYDAFKFQDANQEKLIHNMKKWDDEVYNIAGGRGVAVRDTLEGTGDMFREVSQHPERPSMGYINEKIRRLDRFIDETNFRHYDYQANKGTLAELKSIWEKQPVTTEAQKIARDINIAVIDNDLPKARQLVEQFKNVAQQPGKVPASELKVQQPETPAGMKERGFVKTLTESPNVPPEYTEGVNKYYKPQGNPESLSKANQILLTEGWDGARKRVMSGKLDDETVALGDVMLSKLLGEGRIKEFKSLFDEMASQRTSAGRYIQATSMWNRLTPEGMVKYAMQSIDDAKTKTKLVDKFTRKAFGMDAPDLSKKDVNKIVDLMEKSNAATSEVEKNRYTRQALEIINDRIPFTFSELIDTMRYSGMLSNPLTQLRNFTSNAIQTLFTRPLTKAVSGDVGGSLKYYEGLYNGWGDATKAFGDSWKGEVDIERPDIRQLRVNKFPTWMTWSLKGMEGSDKFFQALIKSGEMAGGTSKQAAEKVAKYSLFRQQLDPTGTKTGQGDLLKAIDKATQGFSQFGKKLPLVRWFVPFVQTPMQVSKQWIEYSPAGVFTLKGADNQSEQLAKTIIGTTITAIGAKIAFDGNTTWSAPTDPQQKELFYASGKKPYSIKVRGKWVPMQTVGIYAFPIALAAAAKHYQEDSKTALTDTQMEKLSKALMAQGEFFSQQTFMEGLGNFVSLLKGEEDYSLPGNIAYTATSVIPMGGLLSYVARVIDPVYRKTPSKNIFGQIKETVQRRIPFASKSLPAYTDPRGNESRRNKTDYGIGGPLLLAPYGQGEENPDYTQAYESRTRKLQENTVLSRKVGEAQKIEQQVNEYLELGEVDKARQLVRGNKETLVMLQTYKEIQSGIKEYQSLREEIMIRNDISNERKQQLAKKLDGEIDKLMKLLNEL